MSNTIYSEEAVARALAKHGLPAKHLYVLPATGIMNEIWSLGEEYVVRIPVEEEAEQYLHREIPAVKIAVDANLRTPELVVYDTDRDVLPLAFTVFRKAPGVMLGRMPPSPEYVPIYQELGYQIAQLHLHTLIHRDFTGILPQKPYVTSIGQIENALSMDRLSADDGDVLRSWVLRLDEVPPSEDEVLVHRDLHPWNLLVDARNLTLTAILDWGDACIGDPALDLDDLPLWALPFFVAAYAQSGGLYDELMIPRLLRRWLGHAMWEIVALDPAVYQRAWWRWPEGGVAELLQFKDVLPEPWKSWLP